MTSFEVSAGGPLRGRIRVPGDKSISHRALMFAALADGASTVRGLSIGEDVKATQKAMAAFGVVMSGPYDSLVIEGGVEKLRSPEAVIDLGNSGTGMRLMAGWASPLPFVTVLAGDESLSRRPMKRVIEPLERMGARIEGSVDGTLAPLTIHGARLHGIEYTPPVASAQLKSAVLIAGLSAEGTTVVHEPVMTRAHTEEMLAMAGAAIDTEEHADGSATIELHPTQLKAFDFDIPGDPSQAAFWMVAATVVPGSDVTIENVYVGAGRAGLIDVLVRMGADIDMTHIDANTADIRVRHSVLVGTDVGGEEVPSLIDELPILAVAAACAEGVTTVTDAAEMRVKESDRIAAVATQLGGLGVTIEERPDGFIIQGRPDHELSGGAVEAHLDHRIAMTGAIAGLLASTPTVVHGWESVGSSYPTFADDLAKLRGITQ